ncbi:MAG: hypothetical protein ABJI22_18960 [Maribacter sp.]
MKNTSKIGSFLIVVLFLFLFQGCDSGTSSDGDTEIETEAETEGESDVDTNEDTEADAANDLLMKSILLSQIYSLEDFIFNDWVDLYKVRLRISDVRNELVNGFNPEGGLTDDSRETVRLKSCEIGTYNLKSYAPNNPDSHFIEEGSAVFFDFYGVSLKSADEILEECPSTTISGITYYHGAIDFKYTESAGQNGIKRDYNAKFGNYPNSSDPEPYYSYDQSLVALYGDMNYKENLSSLTITSPYIDYYRALNNAQQGGYNRDEFETIERRILEDYTMDLESDKILGSYKRTYSITMFFGGDYIDVNYSIILKDINLSDFESTLAGSYLNGEVAYEITMEGFNGEEDRSATGQVNFNGDAKDINYTYKGVSETLPSDHVSY